MYESIYILVITLGGNIGKRKVAWLLPLCWVKTSSFIMSTCLHGQDIRNKFLKIIEICLWRHNKSTICYSIWCWIPYRVHILLKQKKTSLKSTSLANQASRSKSVFITFVRAKCISPASGHQIFKIIKFTPIIRGI